MPFKDKRFLRDLLYAELKKLGIRLEIPMNQLIPTFNSRMFYIDFIFQCVGQGYKKGLDIGIGSSCIYPLLGYTKYQWDFVGTEIDMDSIYFATENVKRNNAIEHIEIIKGKSDVILPRDCKDSFDFTMCNPPFYASQDQIAQSRILKEQDPSGICTGNENEMITDGGEVKFIIQMITESKTFPAKLFTTLVGIKSSLEPITEFLDSENIDFQVHPFRIGKTRRTIITWQWNA